jgi:hypothetical protein
LACSILAGNVVAQDANPPDLQGGPGIAQELDKIPFNLVTILALTIPSGLLQLRPNTVMLLRPAVVMDEEGMLMKVVPPYPASMPMMTICFRGLSRFLVRSQLQNHS